MKRVMLVLCIALGGITSAHADVRNFMGIGESRADACNEAKSSANESIHRVNSQYLGTKDTITSFSQCDCEQSDGGTYYTCYVDAYVNSESTQ